jgi:ABC-type glycerol-3-phosphate transport system substrate-binding protein
LTDLVNEWAAKEKVEIKIDYIPSQGQKNILTIAAEAQAKAGHDMLALPTWWPADKAKDLEPVDDVMKVLLANNGAVSPLIEYLGRVDGRWIAIPATPGSQIKGPCGRIDLFKQHAGMDIVKMYPAGKEPDKALSEAWTWEALRTFMQDPAAHAEIEAMRPPSAAVVSSLRILDVAIWIRHSHSRAASRIRRDSEIPEPGRSRP